MKIYNYPEKQNWPELLKRPTQTLDQLTPLVRQVFNEVKSNGNQAVSKYTRLFDNTDVKCFQVDEHELAAAKTLIEPELFEAIIVAQKNIEKFHKAQKQESEKIETTKGVTCWRKSVGIDKVGIYIPGGTAPLFSTVLMLAIPAKMAGCKEIILCTPPNGEGKINPAILVAAQLVGVNKIYKIGGIQAIAALTYGTETIAQVYKIFGPGNQYVTAAKQFAQNEGVAIDMPAGPSELLVIADDYANPAFVAADLLSQAEHGEDSHVVLVSDSKRLIDEVNDEIMMQLSALPRQDIVKKALEHALFILVNDIREAVDFSNAYSPEHLIINTKSPDSYADWITNAGSVFIGQYTPESAGDYASGTNHTLPTNGFARSYSGVSLDTFITKITFQEITEEGLSNIGPTVEIMAQAEHLEAHRNAVTIRLNTLL